jgi:hypothetical protein
MLASIITSDSPYSLVSNDQQTEPHIPWETAYVNELDIGGHKITEQYLSCLTVHNVTFQFSTGGTHELLCSIDSPRC